MVPRAKEEALRELYFFDLLAAGIYIARRGMIAMSLPLGAAECDSLFAAVEEFCTLRGRSCRSLDAEAEASTPAKRPGVLTEIGRAMHVRRPLRIAGTTASGPSAP